jgi:hypothetical protein
VEFVTIKQKNVEPGNMPNIYHGTLLEKYDRFCRIGLRVNGMKAIVWECYYDYWELIE